MENTEVNVETNNVSNPVEVAPVEEQRITPPSNEVIEKPVVEAIASSEETLEIPEKFRGKDPVHIIKNYVEVEKQAGKLATELDEARRKVKEFEEYKARLEAQSYQQPIQQPLASQNVKTAEDQYEEEWDQDPKRAALNYTKRKQQELVQSMSAAQTTQFYTQAKTGAIKGMEDFAELEPIMTAYARDLAPYVSPEVRMSPQFIQALHLMARGATLDQRVQKATQKAVSNASAKLVQKESAFAEGSSSSSGDRSVKFDELSLAEMRKLLPVSQMVE